MMERYEGIDMGDSYFPPIDLSFLNDDDDADEGYRSTETSPDWTTTSDQQFTFETVPDSATLDCCSLLKSTWKVDPLVAPLPVPDAWAPSKPLLFSRDYRHLRQCRAIVTMDVETISSEGTCPVDSQGRSSHFVRKPWGIACNSKTEQMYVADREHHVIMVFSPDGQFEFQFGGRGGVPGKFFRPTALAYDTVRDRLFVVDKDNHRVQVFTATGEFVFQFGRRGTKPGDLWYPWGIAVSRDCQFVAVADSRNHRVQLHRADNGNYLRHFTTSSKDPQAYKAVFNYPRGIAFDPTGQFIYVTDFNLHSVFRLNIDLTHLEKLVDGSVLSRPSGIEVDGAGNIIVCDSRNHHVKVFQPDGQLLSCFDRLRENFFDLPVDVTMLPAGFLAVLDLNGRVRIF